MDVYQLGRAIIVSPEKIAVRELARVVKEGMGEQRVCLEQLLAELREGIHEYKQE